MFQKMIGLLGVVLLCLVAAPTWGQTLNGQWRVKTGVVDGQTVPAASLRSMTLTIDKARFSAVSGNLTSSGTLLANIQADPAQLVFTIESGADAGNKVFAIYKLDTSGLMVTYSKDGSFPTTFDSTPENKYVKLVYTTGTASSTAAAGPGQGPNQTGVSIGAGKQQDSGGASSAFK